MTLAPPPPLIVPVIVPSVSATDIARNPSTTATITNSSRTLTGFPRCMDDENAPRTESIYGILQVMAQAGYSGTPLPQKLGIKEGHVVLVLSAPPGFDRTLGMLPTGATVARKLAGKTPLDVILAFVTKRADLVDRIAVVRPRMAPAAGLWIAWPKKSSGVPTEVTEDTIRELALPTGLVDNKVCAIDATWSGLRLVIRRALR